MKNALVILLGKSKAGKNTIAEILQKNYYTQQISPIAPLKHHLEDVFNLPRNALESYEYKNTKLPSGLCTYQTLLESFYFFWQKHEPLYAAKMLELQIDIALNNAHEENKITGGKCLLVFFSVRKPNEIDVILHKAALSGNPIIVLHITRNNSANIDTDEFLNTNLNRLKNLSYKNPSIKFLHIENNFNCIEDLEQVVEKEIDEKLRQLK